MAAYPSEVGGSQVLATPPALVQITPVCCSRTAAGSRGEGARLSSHSGYWVSACERTGERGGGGGDAGVGTRGG